MIQIDAEKRITSLVWSDCDVNEITMYQDSLSNVLRICCNADELDQDLGFDIAACLGLLNRLKPTFKQQEAAFSFDDEDTFLRIPKTVSKKQKMAIVQALGFFDSPNGTKDVINPIVKAIDIYK